MGNQGRAPTNNDHDEPNMQIWKLLEPIFRETIPVIDKSHSEHVLLKLGDCYLLCQDEVVTA